MNWNVDTPEGMRKAVEWQTEFVKMFKPQTRWMVPRSGSIISIDNEAKRAVLLMSLNPRGDTSIAKVFKAMGWEWIDMTMPKGRA